MKAFIDKTIKPVLIIGGIGTALAGLDAFLPQLVVENVQKLEWVPDYTIFVQHWGIMVCLVFSNLRQTFAGGFLVPAVMDAAITVWSIVYFISLRRKTGS